MEKLSRRPAADLAPERKPWSDPRGLVDREWIIALGDGGYALGTEGFVNTRRYHGLLVAATRKPRGRYMLVPRVEEVLETEHGTSDLGSAYFLPAEGAVQGLGAVVAFRADPWPTWTLEASGRLIERRLEPSAEGRGLRLAWRLLEGRPATLLLRPLFAGRDHHALVRKGDFAPRVHVGEDFVLWRRAPGTPLALLRHNGRLVSEDEVFYEDVFLPVEKARGYDHVEDLHAPVRLACALEPAGDPARLLVATPDPRPGTAPVGPQRPAAAGGPGLFLVRHPDGRPGILAGYPWFTEWGRDTMLSLPGLLGLDEDLEPAWELLATWGGRLRDGLLPNRLEEGDAAERSNSADAPLLFLRALRWLAARDDGGHRRARRFAAWVDQILDACEEGTRHGIGIDREDGLLRAGAPGLALTWMDAVLPDGRAVTPRSGKPIELNALLHEGLAFGAGLAHERGDTGRAGVLEERRTRLGRAMAAAFLTEGDEPVLRDLVPERGAEEAEAFRPNLLFALADPDHPFPRAVARRTLERVERELLTPMGLRTLSPRDPRYVGRYGGDQPRRDAAYHQGTVWPWLMGLYVDAVLVQRGEDDAPRAELIERLATLRTTYGARGTLPEVCDGDAPHHPGGCPAQAWSVAELRRAAHRLGVPPAL